MKNAVTYLKTRKRRQRFVAPARGDVVAETFAHPVFAEFGDFFDLLSGPLWPDLGALNDRVVGAMPRFVAQTPTMLADGLHYESRIAQHAHIATRAGNWHDLLNALVWLRYPEIKRALNARQVADIALVGARERTRGQCALTLFDEGGIIVIARDMALLEPWDRHDWPQLFGTHAALWQNSTRVLIFGHALLEHALDPEHLLVGKAVIVEIHADPHDPQVEREAIAGVARAIASGELLQDPRELRAMPISGLAGWHRSSRDATERERFLETGECFRPLAAGRQYPGPLEVISPRAQPSAASLIADCQNARMHG